MQALLGVLAALVGIAGHVRASCFTNPPRRTDFVPKCQFKKDPRDVPSHAHTLRASVAAAYSFMRAGGTPLGFPAFHLLRSLRGRLSKAVRRGSEGGQGRR